METLTPELKILENWVEMGIAIDGIVISPRISSYKEIQLKDGIDSFKIFSVKPKYPAIVIAFREVDTGVYENWIGVIINGKSFEIVALSAEGHLTGPYGEFDTLQKYKDTDEIENGISWAEPLHGLSEDLNKDYLNRLKIEQPALYKMLSELEVDPNGLGYLENFLNLALFQRSGLMKEYLIMGNWISAKNMYLLRHDDNSNVK
jgi:hypothetical protein